jgi:hypothetical protein
MGDNVHSGDPPGNRRAIVTQEVPVRRYWGPHTEIERAADRLDCDLYRVLCQIERLWEREKSTRPMLAVTLHYLRQARPNLRALMCEEDRRATL